MKKSILNLTVMAMSILLISGLALAQHGHGGQQSDSPNAAESQSKMMPMHQKMMGQGMMQGGMMAQCKMHGQMGQKMMGMSDPVIKALHPAGCPGFVLKSADKLELSEKQVSDLKSIKSDFQKFSIRKNADIKIAKLELRGLLDSANPDFGKIKNKVEQIGALEQGLRFEFLSTVQKSRETLTAEQLNKLKGLSKNCCTGMMGQGMMK